MILRSPTENENIGLSLLLLSPRWGKVGIGVPARPIYHPYLTFPVKGKEFGRCPGQLIYTSVDSVTQPNFLRSHTKVTKGLDIVFFESLTFVLFASFVVSCLRFAPLRFGFIAASS
jgi:hypothetical protein